MRRIFSVLSVATLMAAMLSVAALPAFAQQGPPSVSRGCDEFFLQAVQTLITTPALQNAFEKQFTGENGIGPCFAPQDGGRVE